MTLPRYSRPLFIKFLGLWGAGQTPLQNKDDDITRLKVLPNHIASTNALSTIDFEKAVANCRREVRHVLLDKGAPGLTICVSKNGRIVWQEAFGYCDVENQIPCEPDARMRIASISKSLFAATVVGPMIESKRADINSSIHNHLSEQEFPKQKFNGKQYDITIEQLLAHTSGIRQYSGVDDNIGTLRPIGSKESKKIFQTDEQYNEDGFYQRKRYRNVLDALEPFKDGPLAKEPGQFNYTTYGYTLLSAVAQKIHQATCDETKDEQIEDYWVKVLRKDWGMNETDLDQEEPLLPKRARYYMRNAPHGALINAPFSDSSIKWAGGGIISTVQDLVKFANHLIDSYKGRDSAVLKRETIDALWKVVQRNYALGFQVRSIKGDDGKESLEIHHTGSSVGGSSVLYIYPEEEVVVAILTNIANVNLRPLGVFVASQFQDISQISRAEKAK